MAKQTFTSGQVLTAQQMNDLQTNDFNMTVTTQTANYTLQAADKGTREVMNMGSAGTVTVPNSTFNAGDAVWLHSIGSGTITIAAGTGLTLNSSAGTAPTLAQWEGGVVYFTSASAAIFFRGGGGGTYGVASGGTESDITVGTTSYKLHTFTGDGTLTVTTPGLFDVLLFGGGGAGGAMSATTRAAGGGGAGGVVQSTVYLAGNTTITIGAGGVGSSTVYTSGSGSSLGNSNRSLNVAGGGIGGGIGQEQTIPTTGGCDGGS